MNKKEYKFELSESGEVYCPRCLDEAYGLIYKAKIKKLDKVIYLCDECEWFWESEDSIGNNELAKGFEKYMENKGIENPWGELIDIDDFWFEK